MSKIDQAWELLFEGKVEEAKLLVEEGHQVDTCMDLSALNLFAYLYIDENNFEDALLACQSYIQLAREEQNTEQEHIGLHQLAMVYRSQGNFKKALELIEEEAKLLATDFSEDKLKWSVNDYEQGYLRLQLGELDSALHFMKRSLENALMTDDLIARACAYRGLGEIYATSRITDLAEQVFTQSITAFEEANDDIGVEEVRALMISYHIN